MTAKAEILEEKVRSMILGALPKGATTQTVIFGPGGVFDSLALVNLLADLEYGISEEFDRSVILASEQAMSQRRSPFRDVATLTQHVVELLGE